MQVSKPYASFFSDSNLASLKLGGKDRDWADGVEPEDIENIAMMAANPGDADQGQAEDDFGDGDMNEEMGIDDD